MTVDLARVRAMLDQRPEQPAAPTNLGVAGRTWYRITNNAAPATAEVWIYDEIGAWGVSAGDFVAELTATQATDVTVHINSPGGEVWDGLAIYHALRAHPATVTVSVDGAALSAASFIAMAGDRVMTAAQSQWMIHDASGLCMGTSGDMSAMSEVLDQLSQMIAEIYHDRARGGVTKWRGLMRAETWYTPQGAVDAGLADEVASVQRSADEPVLAGWAVRPAAVGGSAVAAVPAVATDPAQPEPAPVAVAVAVEPDPEAAAVTAVEWRMDPGLVRAAVGAAAVNVDPAAFREQLAVAAADLSAAPAAAPAPVALPPLPVPAADPTPAVVADTGLPVADFVARLNVAAGNLPAQPAPPPRAFPATPRTPDPDPEPAPGGSPLTVAEWFRAAIDMAATSLAAPDQTGTTPTADPAPAARSIDPAAFKAALKGATL